MKKIIALLLVACMAFSLAACGGEADQDAVGQDLQKFEESDSMKINKEELPRFKIAFSYRTFSDKLGMQFKNAIQYLCDAYNCEAVFFESGSGDEKVTNIESVLAAGDIDGVITVAGTPAMVAVAQKYNVPCVMACGFPSLEEEIQGVASYDVFLGGVVDDDVWAGEHCIQALYDAGVRNFTFSSAPRGLVKSLDDRTIAMEAFIKEHPDMKLLADSYTMAEWANDVYSFNATYPEMEGMAFAAVDDSIYQAMESEGIADGSVKMAGVDISSQTGTYFQNGVQVWTCGGQYATAMVGWAVLYNYLIDGTRIIEDTSKPLVRQYIEIKSYEDYENYVKYVESPLPTYDADEIAEMIHYFNPNVTYQDFEEDAKQYTLEDIIARHGDEIQ